jgi:hypothetical protein
MVESGRGVLLNTPYQGNEWWMVMGCCSLFLLYHALSDAWSKRKAGLSVDIRAVIAVCIFILAFLKLAVSQVMTH